MKILGFGLMRPPMIGDQPDLEQVIKMVDLFMEKGFTYFDTARAYFDGGNERMIREALVKRYPRESFTLADKLPIWIMKKTGKTAEEILHESLDFAGVDYFDYYLIHSLSGEAIEEAETMGLWDTVRQAKEEGLVRSIGFSFHDSAEKLEQILLRHPEAEFVQLQINYADWENERVQSRACYETVRRFGLPVVIMEPVKGGTLAALGDQVAEPFAALEPAMSLPARALRFAASLEGVRVVLSGMSSLEQMEENTMTLAEKPVLSEEEQAAYAEVQRRLAAADTVPCTGCRYCTDGCPIGMEIPRLFRILNQYRTFGNREGALRQYDKLTAEHPRASECLECYACTDHCPQHLEIPELLKKVAETFES